MVQITTHTEARPASGRQAAALAMVLAVTTAAFFSRALGNGFVELDDTAYITRNPIVQQGITAESLAWISREKVVGNWHPVTMLSHLLDVQFYGLNPWGHHLTSVALHAANTALVFLLLWRMTGATAAAAIAALIFGWHPQRVESVAWVAERKDVLSSFFGLLALLAYVHWTGAKRPAWLALVAALLAVGLMAKPMLVTLPLAMVLLDFWPLGRLRPEGAASTRPAATHTAAAVDWSLLPIRLFEKWPLLILTVLFSVITYLSQQEVVRVSSPGLLSRLIISATAYVDYLSEFLVPTKLAAYYPLTPDRMQFWPAMVSVAALAIATSAVLSFAVQFRYLAVGWFWFLGTLVPVIGIVKVGVQARADRYMYLPSIGIAVLLAWGLAQWAGEHGGRRRAVAAGLAVWLIWLGGLTWRQIGTWRDSETLFRHATEVTERNAVAMNGLSHALIEQGRLDEALACLDQALEWAPQFGVALCSKAYTLHHLGRYEEALEYYRRMIDAGQNGATERINFGRLLLDLGQHREALVQFEDARRLAPERPEAVTGAAAALAGLGRWSDAAQLYGEILRAQPQNAAALVGLARVHLSPQAGALRQPAQAVRLAEQACELTGRADPQILDVYALALATAGKYPAAAEAAGKALECAQATEPRTPLLERLIADLERRQQAYRRGRME